MDWKDGLIAATIVGLGYLGITSITKEKDEEESNDCPFCSGKIDFEEAYIELPRSLCDGCYDAVMEKRHDHAYSAESLEGCNQCSNNAIGRCDDCGDGVCADHCDDISHLKGLEHTKGRPLGHCCTWKYDGTLKDSHLYAEYDGGDPEVIGTIWFDDASSYPQSVTLIEEVSELLWGANDDGTREPFTIEETIERLQEVSDKAYAWDLLLEYFSTNAQTEDDTGEDYAMRELMDRISEEARGDTESFEAREEVNEVKVDGDNVTVYTRSANTTGGFLPFTFPLQVLLDEVNSVNLSDYWEWVGDEDKKPSWWGAESFSADSKCDHSNFIGDVCEALSWAEYNCLDCGATQYHEFPLHYENVEALEIIDTDHKIRSDFYARLERDFPDPHDWEAESFSADDKKVRQALKRVGPLANEVRDIGKTLRNSLKD